MNRHLVSGLWMSSTALCLVIAGSCTQSRGQTEASAASVRDGLPAPEHAGQSSAPGQHSAIPVATPLFDTAKPAALEVSRARTGHLLVKPVVNGVASGWFIFDTGAGICVVSTPHADAFHLAAAGDIDSQGIGGGEKSKLFRASTLTLGPMTLRDHTVMTTDLSFLQTHLGEDIWGVIGFGVLSQCVAEIDPIAPGIALHDPAVFALDGCEWLSADLVDRVPAIAARFEDHAGLFHIDTGSNSGVSLSASAVTRWKLLEGRDVQDSKLGGVGGFIAAKTGKLAWFEFGGVRQVNVPATFSLETKGVLGGERVDGSIGAEVLRPFVLVTDYAHERVAFRPRAAVEAR
jgi:hypothetical protein